MDLLLYTCKSTKSIYYKMRVWSIIGVLIRHATVIENELSQKGLIYTLQECLLQKNENVRRKAVAALGEFLFYTATQFDDSPSENHVWQV